MRTNEQEPMAWDDAILDAVADDLMALQTLVKARGERFPLATTTPLSPTEQAEYGLRTAEIDETAKRANRIVGSAFQTVQSVALEETRAIEAERYSQEQSLFTERDFAEMTALLTAHKDKGDREKGRIFADLIEGALDHGNAIRAKLLWDTGSAADATLSPLQGQRVEALLDALPHRVAAAEATGAVEKKVALARLAALKALRFSAETAGKSEAAAKARIGIKSLAKSMLGSDYRETVDPSNLAGVVKPMVVQQSDVRTRVRT